jgi:pyruvate/2-oxoglutarate dehydrogenase complex dihydrolipoamide acyltransferase (E2) component
MVRAAGKTNLGRLTPSKSVATTTHMRSFRPLEPFTGWRRLAVHSWRAPHDPTVHAILEIPMTEALAYLERIRAEHGVRVTVTHLVAKALALAMRRYPQLNGIVARGRIMLRETIDMFVQVATEGGSDLAGVKISRVDERSVVEIARETDDRVRRLREHRDQQVQRTKQILDRIPLPILGPLMRAISFMIYDLDLDLTRFGIVKDEFGSAMISNVGSFGISTAMAPLVPFSRTPVVLLLGEVEDRVVAEEGRPVVRPMMTIGVTFDHRFMDGYQSGKMLQIFRGYLENPAGHEVAEPVLRQVASAT